MFLMMSKQVGALSEDQGAKQNTCFHVEVVQGCSFSFKLGHFTSSSKRHQGYLEIKMTKHLCCF